MLKTMIAALTVIGLTVPAHAKTFRAENQARVTPLSGGQFSVAPERYFGVPGQWCGAADYAVRVLGADWNDRIYVQGKGQRRAVVFSLTPTGNTPQKTLSIAATANIPGSNFSVQRAYAFCLDQRQPTSFFN